jgi:hypothetical protein
MAGGDGSTCGCSFSSKRMATETVAAVIPATARRLVLLLPMPATVARSSRSRAPASPSACWARPGGGAYGVVRTPLAIRVTLGLGGEPSEADAIAQNGVPLIVVYVVYFEILPCTEPDIQSGMIYGWAGLVDGLPFTGNCAPQSGGSDPHPHGSVEGLTPYFHWMVNRVNIAPSIKTEGSLYLGKVVRRAQKLGSGALRPSRA